MKKIILLGIFAFSAFSIPVSMKSGGKNGDISNLQSTEAPEIQYIGPNGESLLLKKLSLAYLLLFPLESLLQPLQPFLHLHLIFQLLLKGMITEKKLKVQESL